MPQTEQMSTLKRAGVCIIAGLCFFTCLIFPAFGLETALQQKLETAEGLAREVAGAAIDSADYPGGALPVLSKANQAIDLAYELVQEAKTRANGEISMQAVEVIDTIAVSVAAIVDRAPAPEDTAVLESALNLADTAAKALLAAAETARETGNTELALAVAESAAHIGGIIHAILQIAVENTDSGLTARAIAAEGSLSLTVRELAAYAETAGNPELARQAVQMADSRIALLEQAFSRANDSADPGMADQTVRVIENYAEAVLSAARLAETTGNRDLGQPAVNTAFQLAATLNRMRPVAAYAISAGDDPGVIQEWEAVLVRIENAEAVSGQAIAAGVASGAVSPGRPPGPGGWWREPPLDETRIAEDEEAASPMRP